ncbi:MAG: hypothetical protein CMF31_04430 [Kordiimonas sp.]|nr:hypothetical protein [Kordiimonas sp.]
MTSRVVFLSDSQDRAATSLLPWVMAVMVYLCALALAGSLSLQGSLTAWTSDLTHRLTVQITVADPVEREKQTEAALSYLASVPGLESAERIDGDAMKDLLAPWLGRDNITNDLPIPSLIDIVVEKNKTINLTAVQARLRTISPQAVLDDHQQWLGDLMELSVVLQSTFWGIVLLVVLATICIVIFGTKAGMAEHRDTIEIMHLMGAHDTMIATEFQRRFMHHGFKGGLIGVVIAAITLFALAKLITQIEGSVLTTVSLSWIKAMAILLLPFAAAVFSAITARWTVMRELQRML